MSQIVFDAIQALRGDLETTIGSLRQELADQELTIKRLGELATNLQTELKRMQASQDLVGAIVSPYGPKNGHLPKMDQEKARTVRALLQSEVACRILELRASGDSSHALMAIHKDGLKAWGTWTAYWDAVKAAKEAKP